MPSPPTPTPSSSTRTSRPMTRIDAIVPASALTLDLARELERLAPFGLGNPDVTLLVAGCEAVGAGDGRRRQAPAVPGPPARAGRRAARSRSASAASSSGCRRDARFDVAFRLKQNRWNGTVSPQLVVRRVFDTSAGYEELRTWLAELWRAGEPAWTPEARRIFGELAIERRGRQAAAARIADVPGAARARRTAHPAASRLSSKPGLGRSPARQRRASARADRGSRRAVRSRPCNASALARGREPRGGRAIDRSSSARSRSTRRRSRYRRSGPMALVLFGRQERDPVTRKGTSTLRPWPSSMPNVIRTTSSSELIANVEAYNPGVDKELIRRAFDEAERAHHGQVRRSGEPFINHPLGVALICAQLHLDEQTIAAALLHDVIEDTETELDELRASFGPDIVQLVEGVTKLTRISFQSREQAEAENYRKMIVAMAQDVRVILIKLADRLHNMRTIEYLGKQKQVQKAKETLEVYAPLAHRLGIHAVKWELEDLSFQILHPRKYAEIKAMVADRRADREAQVETRGGRAEGGSREGGHPRRHLRTREALLLDLRQDGQEGSRVQRDLRPHGDARADRARRRGGDARLLRRARDHPRALEADAGAVQGLHRDAEAEPLPLAPHDRDRAERDAARDPGADPRDARGGRVRRRRALALQARPVGEGRRRVGRVGEDADGLAGRRPGRRRVHAHAAHRPLRRRGVRLHPEGRGEDAAGRRDADRLRVRRAHRRRPQDGRRQGQRPHRAAALQAEERRLRRDPDVEVGPRAVARLDVGRRLVACTQQDPAVVPARDEGRDRGEGPRGARSGAEGAEPSVPQAPGLGRAGAGDPRSRVQEGGGLLPRRRLREARHRARS